MRIRSTKPEFWRSNRIASVSWEARFVLKGLESYVDDNGVGKDDLELIVGDLFSRDLAREPSRALKRVQVAIDELFHAGLVHRYEVDETKLLYISWWESAQYINRPTKGRYPRPDGTSDYGDSKITGSIQEPSRALKSPQSLIRGTGEQGNRGTEEKTSSPEGEDAPPTKAASKSDVDAWFAEWYLMYPRKAGRQAARTKYGTVVKRVGHEVLLTGLRRYLDELKCRPVEKEFIKHPATWLSKGCWEDEYDAPRPDQDRAPVVIDEYKLWN